MVGDPIFKKFFEMQKILEIIRTGVVDTSLINHLGKGFWRFLYIGFDDKITLDSNFKEEIIYAFIKEEVIKKGIFHDIVFHLEASYWLPSQEKKPAINECISYLKEHGASITEKIGKDEDEGVVSISFDKKCSFLLVRDIVKNLLLLKSILSVYEIHNFDLTVQGENKVYVTVKENKFEITTDIKKDKILSYFNELFLVKNTNFPSEVSFGFIVREIIGNDFKTAIRRGEFIKEYGQLGHIITEKYPF